MELASFVSKRFLFKCFLSKCKASFCSLTFSLFLVSFSTHAFASPSIEDYAKLTPISKMRISPNGNLISFIRKENNSPTLMVYSIKDKKMIDGVKLGDLTPYSSYFMNEDQIIFVAGEVRRLMGYRNESNLTTAFLMDLKSKDLRQLLVPGKGIFQGQSGLGDIVGLSEDRRYAFMPAYTGDDFYSDQNPEFSLMKVDLTKERTPRRVIAGSNSSYRYFVDFRGEPLAELRYNNQSNVHQVFAYKNGKKHKIYHEEEVIRSFYPVGLTPTQDAILITSNTGDSGRYVLRTLSLVDGSISAPLFERSDADVQSFYSDIHGVVHGVIYSGLNPSYEFFDKKITTRLNDLAKKMEGLSVWLESWTEDRSKFIISVEGTGSSGAFYLVDEDNQLTFLADQRANIPADKVHPIGKVTYQAQDGLPIPTILTIPKGKVSDMKNLPAIMLPHGGPEANDVIGFDWLAQALANEGYLVIQPQFRGSDGFGVAHRIAGRGEWGKKMQSDLTDAVDFLARKGIVDANRVCIVGASYGGYAALAGATFTPDVYKCSVSINGVTDIYDMLKDERWEHGRDSWVLSYWNEQWTGEESAKVKYDKNYFNSISPSEHVDKIKIPVLLIHGSKDRVVSIDQSKLMFKRMKKAEKPVQFVKLKGEDHYLSTYETRLKALSSTIAFVNKHLAK